MRIGLISDIHGNYSALLTALGWLRRQSIDQIVCAGDLVGYNAQVVEVVERIAQEGIACVRGNHEALLDTPEAWPNLSELKRKSLEFSHRNLDTGARAFLSALPLKLRFDWDGRSVLMVHGSPRDPLYEYLYPEKLVTFTEDPHAEVVVLGHTHKQFQQRSGSTLYVNPGSCGVLRDGDPRLGCGILDTKTADVRLVRLDYNTEPVINANRAAHFPEEINDYLRLGKRAITKVTTSISP